MGFSHNTTHILRCFHLRSLESPGSHCEESIVNILTCLRTCLKVGNAAELIGYLLGIDRGDSSVFSIVKLGSYQDNVIMGLDRTLFFEDLDVLGHGV